MFQKELSFHDLNVGADEVYRQMGYGDQTPDDRTVAATLSLLSEAATVLQPRFGFVVKNGQLDVGAAVLRIDDYLFKIGRIIARQLEGAEAFAFFVATAGASYSVWSRQPDVVNSFIVDAIGSVVAEHCADAMEQSLQATIDKLHWRHTNRFSPGYCGWKVAEQQSLFQLFDNPNPCGVQLTDSSLMMPIKSVSGVVGLGRSVNREDYVCQLCQFEKCFRRKH